MSVDPKIIEAIELSVEQNGQLSSLSTKIVAWLQAISSGKEDINDNQATDRRLELLYEATPVSLEKGILF